jgi:hypothetical protein
MNLIRFPNSNKPKIPETPSGVCFSWKDVEFVEASKTGKTIIHFFSGKTYSSSIPFAEGRKKYINSRKASRR